MLGADVWLKLMQANIDKLRTGGYTYVREKGVEIIQGWHESVQESHKDVFPPPSMIIVTDIRYENEHELVKKQGGTTYLVDRTNLESNDPHISESWVKTSASRMVDEVIVNDSTLGDYVNKCQSAWWKSR
jgi:hypothetical protein